MPSPMDHFLLRTPPPPPQLLVIVGPTGTDIFPYKIAPAIGPTITSN
jgi:hypothetical protein